MFVGVAPCLQWFITDHSIPVILFPMGTRLRTLVPNGCNSATCVKLFNLVRILKKMLIIKFRRPKWLYLKLHMGCDEQYAYGMRAQISNVNNYCARNSLKCHTPWSFLVRLRIFQFSGMFSMPLYGIGNGAHMLEKSGCLRGHILVLHGMLGIPSPTKSWTCMTTPRNIARSFTEVSFTMWSSYSI